MGAAVNFANYLLTGAVLTGLLSLRNAAIHASPRAVQLSSWLLPSQVSSAGSSTIRMGPSHHEKSSLIRPLQTVPPLSILVQLLTLSLHQSSCFSGDTVVHLANAGRSFDLV